MAFLVVVVDFCSVVCFFYNYKTNVTGLLLHSVQCLFC